MHAGVNARMRAHSGLGLGVACMHDGIGGAASQMGDERNSVMNDKLGLKLVREISERIAKTAQLIKIGLETTSIK